MAPARMLLAPSMSPPVAGPPYSDMMTILVALLCAIVAVVGLIAVARCAHLCSFCSSSGGGGGASVAAAKPRLPEGLKKKMIESLIPKLTYRSSLSSTIGDDCNVQKTANEVDRDQCAICLCEIVDGDEIRVLPNCSHFFHVGCIDTWLGSHASCPSCRQILLIAKCHICSSVPSPALEPDFLP